MTEAFSISLPGGRQTEFQREGSKLFDEGTEGEEIKFLDEDDDYEPVKIHPADSLYVMVDFMSDGHRELSFTAYADVVEVPAYLSDGPFNRVKGSIVCDAMKDGSAERAADRVAEEIFDYRLAPDTRVNCSLYPQKEPILRILRRKLFGGPASIPHDEWTTAFKARLVRIAEESEPREVQLTLEDEWLPEFARHSWEED